GGQQAADGLLNANPDIDVLFQVAGKTGNGVLQSACEHNIHAIGVDVDQFVSTPDTAKCTVVSAEKKLKKAVSDAIQRVKDKKDKGGTITLDITTDSVGLSPFHDSASMITPDIHALLGENGAGKTTLMNILYGLVTPDEGEILLGGKPVTIASPADAISQGISMVHQHFMLVPVLTVAENILLGEEPMANPVLMDRKAAHTRIRELGRFFGTEIDPDLRVASLSVGWQQRVEILKALYRNADILVLDEPTAVLTPQETKEIFAVLRRLTAEGTSIIFISHKLYEVLEIADRITVIRRGKVVG